MNPTIIAALIGSIATIVSPILVHIIKAKLEERRFKHLSKERISALVGVWKGTLIQPPESNPDKVELHLDVTCNLHLKRSKIVGVAEYTFKNFVTSTELSGFPIDNTYAKIEYHDKNPHIIRYGSIMTKLSGDGKKLTGLLLGYAAEIDNLVTGTFELRKQ